MANRTLLNEAIAEAESIRDAALANAKAALEESFAPHIKELFSEKVKKMEADDKEMNEKKHDDHDEKELDEMDAASFRRKNSPSHNHDGEGGPVNPAPHKAGKSTIQEEEDEEVELDALLAQLDEEMDKEKVEEGYDKEMDEAKHHDDEKKMDEAKDHDEKELDEADKAKEDEKHLHEEEEEMEVGMDAEMDDDPEIDIEEMTEDELLDLIRDVIDELEDKGEIEADGGEEAEAEIEIEDEMMEGKDHDDKEMDEGVGKWKVRKEGKDADDDLKEGEDEEIKEGEEDLDEGYGKDKEIEEALAEVEKLKKDLHEVNLLNAKLLYSNKIFRSKNLSESQKVKVLESFDKANNAKEAKLIFETLSEGMQTRRREVPTRSRGVKGSASAATKVITENKQPIVESNDMVARFQKLAGIK